MEVTVSDQRVKVEELAMPHRSGTLLSTCAAVAALVVAAGCDPGTAGDASSAGPSKNTTVSASPVPSISKQVPASVAKTGTLRVGVAVGSPPDEFQDENGQLVGWEVDLVKTSAQVLGLKVKFSEASFDSLIPGLQANRYDLAIGQFGVTGDREKVVDFVTTLSANELFAAKSGSNIKVRTLGDLCDHSVATTRGSREFEFAKQQNPKCKAAGKKPIDVKVFDDSNKASLALMSGRADVYWLGSTAVQYFVRTTHGQAKVVGHYLDPNPLGIALQKDSSLSKPVQEAMQHNIGDGTYHKVLDKWGLTNGAIKTSEVNPSVSAN